MKSNKYVKLSISKNKALFLVYMCGLLVILYSIIVSDTTTSILHSDWGLASAFPVSFYIGFFVCLSSTIFLIFSKVNEKIIFLFIIILFAIKVGTIQLASANLINPDSWVHMFTTETILSTHHVDFSGAWHIEWPAQYLGWPGGFLLATILKQITGLPLDQLFKVLPLILYVLMIFPAYLILKRVFKESVVSLLALVFLLFNEYLFIPTHYSPYLVSLFIEFMIIYAVFSIFLRKKISYINYVVVLFLLIFSDIITHPLHGILVIAIILGAWLSVYSFARATNIRKIRNVSLIFPLLFCIVFFSLWALINYNFLINVIQSITSAPPVGRSVSWFKGYHATNLSGDILYVRLVYNSYILILAMIGLMIILKNKKVRFVPFVGWTVMMFIAFVFFVLLGGHFSNFAYKPFAFSAVPIATFIVLLIYPKENKWISRHTFIKKMIVSSLCAIILINLVSTYAQIGGEANGVYFDQEISASTFLKEKNTSGNIVTDNLRFWYLHRFSSGNNYYNPPPRSINHTREYNVSKFPDFLYVYDDAYYPERRSSPKTDKLYDNGLITIYKFEAT